MFQAQPLVKCNTITILVNDVSIIRIEGASEITVSTRSICKTLAISLPSLVEIPILIRLFPDAVVFPQQPLPYM